MSLTPSSIWNTYVSEHKTHVGLLALLTFVYPTQSIINPALSARIVGDIQSKKGMGVSLIMLAAVSVGFIVLSRVSDAISSDMYSTLHAHVVRTVLLYILQVSKFQDTPLQNGRIISTVWIFAANLTNYIEILRQRVAPTIVSLLFQTGYLATVDMQLSACVFLIASVVSATFATITVPDTELDSNLYEHMDEMLLNISAIDAHKELERLRHISLANRVIKRKAFKQASGATVLMTIIVTVLCSLFVARLNQMLKVDVDDLKDATRAVTILFDLVRKVEGFGKTAFEISLSRATMNAAMQVLQKLDTHAPESSPLNEANLEDNVLLEAVNVCKGPLENVTVRIKPGTRLSVVGHGKSTLLKVLAGKLTPDTGTVSGQCKIGYVPQNATLFDRSVVENLTYGSEHLTLDSLIGKLAGFGLWPIFKRLGLNKHVGKNGNRLSAAERKLLLLARVLLQNPDVLLIDDPVAGLNDAESIIVTNILENQTVVFATNDKSLPSDEQMVV